MRRWDAIKAALRTNRKVLFFPSIKSLGAMVYLHVPGHPEADSKGFWEIMALPSPTFFEKCPELDIEYEKRVVRGYRNFFLSACKMKISWPDGTRCPIFKAREIKKYLPEVFKPRRFDSAAFKREVAEKNMTPEQKMQREIKKIMRPIPGNGMPPGWERKVTYSFGS